MCLNVSTFIEIRHTSELIVTDCLRRVYKAFFRVFDVCSIFSLIASNFQLRNINLRCITWHFSNNLRIDMRLNIISFVHIRSTCKLIITNCIRRVYEAFVSILDLSSIFKRITSCFQLRNIDLRSIARYFSDNLSIDMRLNVSTFIEIRSTCELIVTDNVRCIYEAFFRIFNFSSIFGLITSYFQLRHIYRRCITRHFSLNLRIDMCLNIASFVCFSCTGELIITNNLRCIFKSRNI